MQAEHVAFISTRGTALSYHCEMRSPKLLLPLLFILADGVGCKDDAPASNEFGEPCGDSAPCADDLECYVADCKDGQCFGYCEETCSLDSDCRVLDGHQRECQAGVCHILCEEAAANCPQDLATPLQCQDVWCVAAGGG